MSSNLAKNSMRPVAQGRNNWLHVGSAQDAPEVAAKLSMLQSCRRLKLRPCQDLAAVLPGLADTSVRRLPELTPAAWASRTA